MIHLKYEIVTSMCMSQCAWVRYKVNAPTEKPFYSVMLHLWISHVECEWVMSNVNAPMEKPFYSVMSHLISLAILSCRTFEWVTSNVIESCQIWMSHESRQMWMTHSHLIFNVNEYCQIWMSIVKFEWVMSNLKESIAAPLSGSCRIFEWVMMHVV